MNTMQVSEKYISIFNGQVYLKCWLPAYVVDRSPVILFHDSLGCVGTWRDFPGKLAEKLKREVIAYDRLGFGKSSLRFELPSIRFIREEAEIYFPEIIKNLGIKTCLLFGHSVGGSMALTIAEMYPEVCTAVISESAQAFVEDRTRSGIFTAAKEFKNLNSFAKLQKYHGEKAQWVLDAWVEIWLSADFSDWSLKPGLERVRCPVLIIHGDRDEYGSVRFPDVIQESVSGIVDKKILENCGHVPHREKPDFVLDLINDFLSSFE